MLAAMILDPSLFKLTSCNLAQITVPKMLDYDKIMEMWREN